MCVRKCHIFIFNPSVDGRVEPTPFLSYCGHKSTECGLQESILQVVSEDMPKEVDYGKSLFSLSETSWLISTAVLQFTLPPTFRRDSSFSQTLSPKFLFLFFFLNDSYTDWSEMGLQVFLTNISLMANSINYLDFFFWELFVVIRVVSVNRMGDKRRWAGWVWGDYVIYM